MNKLINIQTNDEFEQLVSSRELHEALSIQKDFTTWFKQQAERIGLVEGFDYSLLTFSGEQTGRGGHNKVDYLITIDIAKHLSMISGGENAHRIRQYFIQVERDWNSPEKVMSRALKFAEKEIRRLEHRLEIDKPKVLFAEAVEASVESILVRDFAKLLAKNGVNIGEKRLYEWLRAKGFVQQKENKPTQKAVELGVLELKEGMRFSDSSTLKPYFTTKVTGKGQVYFMNKFLAGDQA